MAFCADTDQHTYIYYHSYYILCRYRSTYLHLLSFLLHFVQIQINILTFIIILITFCADTDQHTYIYYHSYYILCRYRSTYLHLLSFLLHFVQVQINILTFIIILITFCADTDQHTYIYYHSYYILCRYRSTYLHLLSFLLHFVQIQINILTFIIILYGS